MILSATASIRRKTWLTMALVVILPQIVGCSGDKYASHVASISKTNMQKIGNIYLLHVARNGGRGPKTENDLKKFLEEESSIEKNIGMMGIERGDFEKISVHDETQQNFIVRYGLTLPPMSPKRPVVLDPQANEEGFYNVMLSHGNIVQVEQSEYDKMVSGKWKANKNESGVPDFRKPEEQ